ncbi:MAG: NAD-dependent epimerase/dehydratase family protein [Ignavibacteriaceae bacterium]|nr:NAD-dependent epimerase/dehydratase family protein [Ignavibacteriaceae bacterium]
MKNEICVVTGATGFVGSHLVDLLLEKGYQVRIVARKSSNLQWIDRSRVSVYDCGLDDTGRLAEAFLGANYIYHVAGVVKSKTKEGYHYGNVITTGNVLEAALRTKDTLRKLVVVSSQTAAGPSPAPEPIDEQFFPNPITTYGISKREQEKLCEGYYDRLPITVCRACAVYGERDTEIFIFFRTYASGLMTKVGFDEKRLNLIHIADLVNGLYLASLSEKSRGEIYFLASEETYSWDEVRRVCEKVFQKKSLSISIPHFLVYTISAFAEFFSMFSTAAPTLNIEKARDLTRKYWTCSVKKAVNDFGFRQTISLEEGISKTVNWYREKNWL